MSIRQLLEKINITVLDKSQIEETISYDNDGEVERLPLLRKLFLSIIIILVTLLSFGLGRLSVGESREAVKIEYDPSLVGQSAALINATQLDRTASTSANYVVVSKNGARYHYPHCSGAKQIKEENKIVFATPEEALAAGYTLAANCKPR